MAVNIAVRAVARDGNAVKTCDTSLTAYIIPHIPYFFNTNTRKFCIDFFDFLMYNRQRGDMGVWL